MSEYCGNAEEIAAQFMSQGRPAGEPLRATGVNPGDVSMSLEVKTPMPGAGFKEWALRGYEGNSTPGTSDRAPEPGAPASSKATNPITVKTQ